MPKHLMRIDAPGGDIFGAEDGESNTFPSLSTVSEGNCESVAANSDAAPAALHARPRNGAHAALPTGAHTGAHAALPAGAHTGAHAALPAGAHTGAHAALPAGAHTGAHAALPAALANSANTISTDVPSVSSDNSTGKAPHKSKLNFLSKPAVRYGVIAAVVVAVIAVAFVGFNSASAYLRAEQDSASMAENDNSLQSSDKSVTATNTEVAEEADTQVVTFSPSLVSLDSISPGEGVQLFSLAGGSAPTISEAALKQIESAVSAVQAQGAVGFIMYDLQTGAGIACNPDAKIYGASSFKAPYALYICETQSSNVAAGNTEAQERPFGVFAQTDEQSGLDMFTSQLIEASVINSDNDSFSTLRRMYDGDFDAWRESLGIPDAEYMPESDFPWYCARSSAKLWTEMYLYSASGSQTSAWLSGLCSQTTVSFLRDALDSYGATVLNKAGWNTDTPSGMFMYDGFAYNDFFAYAAEGDGQQSGQGESAEGAAATVNNSDPTLVDYNSVTDAGIVTVGGHAYVMSFMSGMPDDDENRALLENLIVAVYSAMQSA